MIFTLKSSLLEPVILGKLNLAWLQFRVMVSLIYSYKADWMINSATSWGCAVRIRAGPIYCRHGRSAWYQERNLSMIYIYYIKIWNQSAHIISVSWITVLTNLVCYCWLFSLLCWTMQKNRTYWYSTTWNRLDIWFHFSRRVPELWLELRHLILLSTSIVWNVLNNRYLPKEVC